MQISSVRPTPRSNKLYVQVPHHQLAQNLMTRSLWQNISRIQGQKLLLFWVNVIGWEYSRHLASPPWVPREMKSEWRAQKFHTFDILEWGLFTRIDVYPCARVRWVKIARVYKQWFHWRVLSRLTLCNVQDLKENLKFSLENTLNSQ